MRFIRKNGRVIPIRESVGAAIGGAAAYVGSRVSNNLKYYKNNPLKKTASTLFASKGAFAAPFKKAALVGLAGAAVGASIGYMSKKRKK